MPWWIAEKGSPWEFLGAPEISQDAAKRGALTKSAASVGTVFQVSYRANANAPAEVRWEAVDGKMSEVTGAAQKSH
jgi:hypothetical protein